MICLCSTTFIFLGCRSFKFCSEPQQPWLPCCWYSPRTSSYAISFAVPGSSIFLWNYYMGKNVCFLCICIQIPHNDCGTRAIHTSTIGSLSGIIAHKFISTIIAQYNAGEKAMVWIGSYLRLPCLVSLVSNGVSHGLLWMVVMLFPVMLA